MTEQETPGMPKTEALTNVFPPVKVDDPYVQAMVCTAIDLIKKSLKKPSSNLNLNHIRYLETVCYYWKMGQDLDREHRVAYETLVEEFGNEEILRKIVGKIKEFILTNEPSDPLQQCSSASDEKQDYFYLEKLLDTMHQVFREEFKNMKRMAPGILPMQISLGDLKIWINEKQFEITPLGHPTSLIKRYREEITELAKKCEDKFKLLEESLKQIFPPVDWYLLSIWGSDWLSLEWLKIPEVHSIVSFKYLGKKNFESQLLNTKWEKEVELEEDGDKKQRLLNLRDYLNEVNLFLCTMNASRIVSGIPEFQASLYYYLKQKAHAIPLP